MLTRKSLILLLGLLVVLAIGVGGCTKTEEVNTSQPVATQENEKIPVTTSSEEARKEFLQGRDKAERLLAQDSIQHFQKAISLDPNFASAELGLANTSPTAKEFFDHLNKAVSLADKASNGEKLLILATEAGANGNIPRQKQLLDELVAAHPNDERAHFNLGGYHFGQQEYAPAKSTTRRLPSLHRTTLPLSTFSVMPTVSTRTTRTPNRRSRSTSS